MNSSPLIRKAKASDFNELNTLMTALGYEIQSSEFETRRQIFETVLIHPHQEVFVVIAADGKSIHAMMSFSVLPQVRLSGLKMEIDELVVSPESRGDGLGSKLVHFAIAQAKSLGVKKIIVSCNRGRESYQRNFYKNLGFIEKNSAFFDFTVS